MTKDKPCKVCAILNEDLTFSNYINTRLKNDIKIADIRGDFEHSRRLPPTEYFLKIHRRECLKDFKAVEPQVIQVSKNVDSTNRQENNANTLNMVEELENYRNMSFQEKKEDHIRMLNEIKYMAVINIRHQLIYGRSSLKAVVPKEDIGALKQVEDILQVLTTDSFDKEETPEVNINTYNTALLNDTILNNYDFPDLKKLENIESTDNEN